MNRLKRTAIPTVFDSGEDTLVEQENKPSTSGAMILDQKICLESVDEAGPSGRLVVLKQEDANTQTPQSLTADSPRKRELRLQIRKLKRSLMSEDSSSSKKPKSNEMSEIEFQLFCKTHFPDNVANFIIANYEFTKRNPKGVRYSNEYKQIALPIYFMGPRAHQFLTKLFRLPSKATLYRITRDWEIMPGLNDFMFSVIKSKTETLPATNRYCSLCIDEMSIKQFLFYNRHRDYITGFHESIKDRSFQPAKYMLALMVRGIRANWKQPVGYFLVHKVSSEELHNIISETILRLNSIGLNVQCIVSDQGANFLHFTRANNITPETPHFTLNNNKIFYFFDVPHLLKSTRNNLFKHKFQCFNGETDKKYLEYFFNKDKHLRIAPKLTQAHIYPNNFQKMKVKLAAQVLSATVAAALNTYIALGALPAAATPTASFIEEIDKLFDIFNSSQMTATKVYNKSFTASEEQVNFLRKMLTFFEQLRVIDNTSRNVTKQMKFIDGWKLSIQSLLSFWEENNGKYDFIFTRRLNQDCLENFFGNIRQQCGNAKNPTPIQVQRSFKKLFCLGYFEHCDGANCIDDMDEVLISIDSEERRKSFDIVLTQKAAIFSNLSEIEPDYIHLELPKKNAINYISGYMIKKCLEKHCCEACQLYAQENTILHEDVYFSYFKAYENKTKDTFGNLMMPPQNFVEYMFSLENIFCKLFPDLAITQGVGINLKNEMNKIELPIKCENFPKEYLISLYVRLRIFYTLKYVNRDLADTKALRSSKLRILQNL